VDLRSVDLGSTESSARAGSPFSKTIGEAAGHRPPEAEAETPADFRFSGERGRHAKSLSDREVCEAGGTTSPNHRGLATRKVCQNDDSSLTYGRVDKARASAILCPHRVMAMALILLRFLAVEGTLVCLIPTQLRT